MAARLYDSVQLTVPSKGNSGYRIDKLQEQDLKQLHAEDRKELRP
jgi:hypothetical protein